jgi:hypothetical protein
VTIMSIKQKQANSVACHIEFVIICPRIASYFQYGTKTIDIEGVCFRKRQVWQMLDIDNKQRYKKETSGWNITDV